MVIACRTITSADVTNDGVPRELAHKVNYDFKKNIRKIDMVDQNEVDKSLKKKMYRIKDFRELGIEFDTDYVLGIELEHFQTSESNSPFGASRSKSTMGTRERTFKICSMG